MWDLIEIQISNINFISELTENKFKPIYEIV